MDRRELLAAAFIPLVPHVEPGQNEPRTKYRIHRHTIMYDDGRVKVIESIHSNDMMLRYDRDAHSTVRKVVYDLPDSEIDTPRVQKLLVEHEQLRDAIHKAAARQERNAEAKA